MEIVKHIYNQTFHNIRINNKILVAGTSMDTTDPIVKIYQTDNSYFSFVDKLLSNYTFDEFVIYITDQHGIIEQANFSDSTLFLSLEDGQSWLYTPRNSEPIINPIVYLYNRVTPQRPQNPRLSWVSRWFRSILNI